VKAYRGSSKERQISTRSLFGYKSHWIIFTLLLFFPHCVGGWVDLDWVCTWRRI